MYKLKLTSRAKKELKNLKKTYEEVFTIAIEELREDPFVGNPLQRNLTNKYSLRVSEYRIIYKVNKQDKVINILSAGHRSGIYK